MSGLLLFIALSSPQAAHAVCYEQSNPNLGYSHVSLVDTTFANGGWDVTLDLCIAGGAPAEPTRSVMIAVAGPSSTNLIESFSPASLIGQYTQVVAPGYALSGLEAPFDRVEISGCITEQGAPEAYDGCQLAATAVLYYAAPEPQPPFYTGLTCNLSTAICGPVYHEECTQLTMRFSELPMQCASLALRATITL